MELNEDKILDFLDGSLTSVEEEELLHRLAVSPERRVVLKQHLQLRELSAILAKKHNYIAPKALTAQLFTNLSANGYAGPMYHAATDTDSLRNSLEANITKSAQNVVEEKKGFRASSIVFSSVLSFIAGAFLVYLLISSPTATGSLATLPGSNNSSPAPALVDNSTQPMRWNVREASSGITSKSIGVASDGVVSGIVPSSIAFASNVPAVELGQAPVASFTESKEIAEEDHANPAVIDRGVSTTQNNDHDRRIATGIGYAQSQNWWDGAGMYSTLDNLRREKGYFGLEEIPDTASFIRRTTVSLRSGGGKAPGRMEDFTGSLVELKLSADIADWLVAKVSFGQFMPYETEALSVGRNADGLRLLKLEPVLQYKSVVGAELGFRVHMFGAAFEAMGGFLTDLRNGFIPRAGIFTSLMLQDNLSLQMGVEGALYTHDIRPSLANKQTIFALEHPVLTNTMRKKETAGFIGPALELAWHF